MSKAEDFQGMRAIPLEAVKEKEAKRRLLPTRDDFKGKPGYWEKPKPGGGYTWGYKFKTNEGGRQTKEAGFVQESMKRYIQEDVARVAAQNGFPGGYAGRGKRTEAHRDGSPAMTAQENREWGCQVLGHHFHDGACEYCGASR